MWLNILCSMLWLAAQLPNVEIPQEENLHITHLSNGVQIWTRENTTPPYAISLRMLWRKEGQPITYDATVSALELDDVQSFFELCCEQTDANAEEATVIAVGDFDTSQILPMIQANFEHLPLVKEALETPKISILSQPEAQQAEVALYYPAPLQPVHTSEDLKRQWALYFLQKLTHQRLQHSLSEHQATALVQSHARFLLPKLHLS